jgi:hypothetical protein
MESSAHITTPHKNDNAAVFIQQLVDKNLIPAENVDSLTLEVSSFFENKTKTKSKTKNKSKTKSKRVANAYIRYLTANRETIRATLCENLPGTPIKVQDITKEAARLWKIMSAADKKCYVDEYLKAKEIAATQSEVITTDEISENNDAVVTNVSEKKKKAKKQRDPNKPKRVPNAYLIYLNESREMIRSQLEQKTFTEDNAESEGDTSTPQKIPVSEVTKEAGKRWKTMPQSEKQYYLQKYSTLCSQAKDGLEKHETNTADC